MPQPTDEAPDPTLEQARRDEHETRPTLATLDRIEGALAGVAAILAATAEGQVSPAGT
jgi:hypothetical protein